jgi:hypothetical protein
VEAGSAVARLAAAAVVKEAKAALSAAGGLAPGVGGGSGLVRYHGGTFSGLFAANLRRAEQAAGHNFIILQGGWKGHGGGARVAASGTSHDGDAVDARQDGSLLRAFRRFVGAMWFRNWTGNYHMHGVPAPGRGYGSASARWQYQDYLRGGNGLASGAIVKGGRGGINARIGEGKRDELVAPLPRNYQNLIRVMERGGGAGVTVNQYITLPHYLGSTADLKRALVDLSRRGELAVIQR